jgi:hypothetical protein
MSKPLTMEDAKRRFLIQAREMIKESARYAWIEPGMPQYNMEEMTVAQLKTAIVDEVSPSVEIFDSCGENIQVEPVSISTYIPSVSTSDWHETVAFYPDGQYICRYFQHGEPNHYLVSLMQRQETGVFRHYSWHEAEICGDDCDGMITTKFHYRYRNLIGKGVVGEKIIVQYASKPVLRFCEAIQTDPQRKFVVDSIPYCLPRGVLDDDRFEFDLLPNKLLMMDVEKVNKYYLETWVVGFVAITDGKIKDLKTYFVRESKWYLDQMKVPVEERLSSDEIRVLILKYQAEGYTIYAKGCAAEALFMLGKDSGVKLKSYLYDNFFYSPTVSEIDSAVAVGDLRCARFDEIAMEYRQRIPARVVQQAQRTAKLMRCADVDHVPVIECMVFFLHWKTYQEQMINYCLWNMWKKRYKGQEFEIEIFNGLQYWDARINEMPLDDISGDSVFVKNVNRMCSQVRYIRDYGEVVNSGTRPLMYSMYEKMENFNVPELRFGILTSYHITSDHAEKYFKLMSMPVSKKFKDSVSKQYLIKRIVEGDYDKMIELFIKNKIEPLPYWDYDWSKKDRIPLVQFVQKAHVKGVGKRKNVEKIKVGSGYGIIPEPIDKNLDEAYRKGQLKRIT